MFLQSVTGIESVYWFCAIAGSAFFLLRMMFGIVGGFGGETGHDVLGHGADLAHATDAHAVSDVDTHGTEAGFKLLSLTSIGAFIMLFGWVGLSMLKDFHLPAGLSFVLALAAGFLTMVFTAYLFKLILRLTSEGALYRIEDLVGQTGTIYQRIVPGGKGKIQISLNGLLREVDAVSDEENELAHSTSVTVTKVVDHLTVCVRKIG